MRKASVLFLIILMSGCAPLTYRTNPRFNEYFDESKTIAAVAPDIKMYKLTAGGVDEYNEVWTKEARALVRRKIKEEVEKFPTLKLTYIEEDGLDEPACEDRRRQLF